MSTRTLQYVLWYFVIYLTATLFFFVNIGWNTQAAIFLTGGVMIMAWAMYQFWYELMWSQSSILKLAMYALIFIWVLLITAALQDPVHTTKYWLVYSVGNVIWAFLGIRTAHDKNER